MQDRSDNNHTFDGVVIVPNLRVLTNDWVWGNVDPKQFDKDQSSFTHPRNDNFDGWYRVILDSGGNAIYNGTRMISYSFDKPDPNPDKRI